MFLVSTSSAHLHTIDTSNGDLADVGPYTNSFNLVGLAFSPVPEPGSLVLFGLGAAYSLPPAAAANSSWSAPCRCESFRE